MTGTMFSLNGFRTYFVINLNQVILNSEIMLQKWQIGAERKDFKKNKIQLFPGVGRGIMDLRHKFSFLSH